jgi:putative hydrolase of the HAD superfamily
MSTASFPRTLESLPAPKGLLLDAMGTLIGLRHSVGHTYAALAGDHGLTVSAEAIDAVFPRLHQQAPPLAFPGLDGAALEQAERQWWADRIAAALAAAGLEEPLPPGLSDALFDRFGRADLWQVYGDVAGALERWHRRGLKLAVVSNFDGRLLGLLRELGLADWISVVVVSSAAGASKPDPAPFALALEHLGLSAAEAWHVGIAPRMSRVPRRRGWPACGSGALETSRPAGAHRRPAPLGGAAAGADRPAPPPGIPGGRPAQPAAPCPGKPGAGAAPQPGGGWPRPVPTGLDRPARTIRPPAGALARFGPPPWPGPAPDRLHPGAPARPQGSEAVVGLDLGPSLWLRYGQRPQAGGHWSAGLYGLVESPPGRSAGDKAQPWQRLAEGSLEDLCATDSGTGLEPERGAQGAAPAPGRERVLLLAISSSDRQASQRQIAELEGLVRSAGADPVGVVEQRRSERAGSSLWGEGKVMEAALEARRLGATLVVTDRELGPRPATWSGCSTCPSATAAS